MFMKIQIKHLNCGSKFLFVKIGIGLGVFLNMKYKQSNPVAF